MTTFMNILVCYSSCLSTLSISVVPALPSYAQFSNICLPKDLQTVACLGIPSGIISMTRSLHPFLYSDFSFVVCRIPIFLYNFYIYIILYRNVFYISIFLFYIIYFSYWYFRTIETCPTFKWANKSDIRAVHKSKSYNKGSISVTLQNFMWLSSPFSWQDTCKSYIKYAVILYHSQNN